GQRPGGQGLLDQLGHPPAVGRVEADPGCWYSHGGAVSSESWHVVAFRVLAPETAVLAPLPRPGSAHQGSRPSFRPRTWAAPVGPLKAARAGGVRGGESKEVRRA